MSARFGTVFMEVAAGAIMIPYIPENNGTMLVFDPSRRAVSEKPQYSTCRLAEKVENVANGFQKVLFSAKRGGHDTFETCFSTLWQTQGFKSSNRSVGYMMIVLGGEAG